MRLFDNHKPSRSSSYNSTKMGATTQPKYSYPLPPPPPPRRQIMTCSQKNEFFTGVRARFGGLVFAEHNSQSYPNVLAQNGEHLIYFVLTLFPAAHFKPKVDPRDADHNRRFIRKFFFSIFFLVTRVRIHVPRLSPKVATGIHCRLSSVTKIRLLG